MCVMVVWCVCDGGVVCVMVVCVMVVWCVCDGGAVCVMVVWCV